MLAQRFLTLVYHMVINQRRGSPGGWRREGKAARRSVRRAAPGPVAGFAGPASIEGRPCLRNPWATTIAGGVTGKLLGRNGRPARIERALFGDQLRDPDRRFDLEIALRARHMLRRPGS